MARSRPCGRSKSDHRVCQAARFARAAEYRERISISAERQKILIAAVNAQSDDKSAPRRRRCQRSKQLKNEGQPAREVPRGRRSSAIDQKANQQDARVREEALNCAAERDPHAIHCRECDTTAEYGLHRGKMGGAVTYFCESHGPSKGCFKIDSDRASWIQGREKARKKANPACPEREQHQKGAGSSAVPRSWTATAGSQGAGVHDARHADEPSAAAATRPTLDPSECERAAASSIGDEAQCMQRPAREGLCGPSNNLRPGRFPATSSRRTALSRSQGVPSGAPKAVYKGKRSVPASAGRDAPDSPSTTSPSATGGDSESDCGLGAARHQHAASDEAQSGQPHVHHAEGLCALSSRSDRFGVQPTATKSVLERSAFQGSPAYGRGSEEVFYSSAPKSKALIATQLMIGGVESNPGWPTHDPDAPSSSCGRPLIHLPIAEEVQKSVKSKPVSLEPFDAWRGSQSNPNWVAEVMARSAVQPARPQWQDPPTAPSVSREETGPSSSGPHPTSNPRPAATEPTPTNSGPSSSPPHPASKPLSAAAEPPPTEVAGRKRAVSSRESSPAPSGTRIRIGSPDEAEVAATSGREAASFDIEETSDETKSDEEPTSDDDRGIDDSALPDAESLDLYRQLEMEEATARLEEQTVDDALEPMRREMQRRRASDEAPPTSVPPMAHKDLVAAPEPAILSDPLTGNEVFKNDEFRVLRVREHGTNCFHQTGANPRGRLPGPKVFMQQEAALLNYGAQNGKPCKPYLDLDWKEGLPFRRQPVIGADGEVVEAGERYDREEVIGLMEKWASIVFMEQYDCELQPSSFVWIESPGQTKFSLHLTINQLAPRQLVFASNTEGALHFARRLKKRLQRWHPALADAIDLNVYSKDREWRTPGSAKIEKPESVLTCINPAHSWKDALVTWLEPLEAREEVKLPFEVPERLHERFRNPRVMSARGTERSSTNDEFVKTRMLALLRERLHPSAYEDGHDRYNYSDRTEPCYTGRIHENRQRLICHLNPNGKIYALCFSRNTGGGDSDVPCVSRAYCLGDLFEDNISYETGAVKLDMEHLKRVPGAST
ncbi:hypothetical protein KFL_008920010, partial [Klebsormidium nitens]